MEYHLHALHRLQKESDPQWPTKKLTYHFYAPNSVPLPQGVTSGANGLRPEDIPDAKLREQFRAAIAENNARIEYWTHQQHLSQLAELYVPRFERWLAEAYADDIPQTNELPTLLSKYRIVDVQRQRILDLIKNSRLK